MKVGRPRKERYALLMGGLWRNPKIRRLSNEALGVLTRAWSYAADEMTDGAIPVEMLEMWARPKRWPAIKAELTRGTDSDGDRPLLTIADGAIDARANGWTDVNISAAKWEAHLEAERKRKGKRGEFPPGNPPGNPSGRPPGFRSTAPDEDEDDDHESATRSQRGRATPAAIVESALVTALGAAKPPGRLALRSGDAAHLTEAANAMREADARPLRDVAAEWCPDFVAEFRVRTPRNLAMYAQSRLANGGAKVASLARGKPSGWQAPAPSSAFEATEITPEMFAKEG